MPTHILGIETSCDETSAAVVGYDDGRVSLESLVILSQDVHAIFGGVVPELASRAHLRTIGPVVDRALAEAGLTLEQVDGIAATYAPGLVGALLVGCMYGKTLAWRAQKPFIGVHHLEGHLFAPTIETPGRLDALPAEHGPPGRLAAWPPFIGLLVSGGHTMLLDVPAWGEYRLLGQTIDDAAGEAFDKVGKLLGLGYPGGPAIERLAQDGIEGRFRFPRPMLRELERPGPQRYAFSFSGLKTAVLRAVQQSRDLDADRASLARGFQDAVVDVLVEKTAHAAAALGYPTIVVGGGVACNRTLIDRLRREVDPVHVAVASPRLNTDNAAMIAAAGAWRLARGEQSGWDLEPRDSLPLPGLILDAPQGIPA